MTNWMLVSGLENFRISRARGFDLAGMKSRHRRKAEKVQPGDRVILYVTGVMGIGAICTAAGTYFEDHEPIWKGKKEDETYPFRFPITPDLVLEEEQFVPIAELVPQLDYVRRYAPEHWRLAFQGNVHILDEHDFSLIEDAVRDRLAVPASQA